MGRPANEGSVRSASDRRDCKATPSSSRFRFMSKSFTATPTRTRSPITKPKARKPYRPPPGASTCPENVVCGQATSTMASDANSVAKLARTILCSDFMVVTSCREKAASAVPRPISGHGGPLLPEKRVEGKGSGKERWEEDRLHIEITR